MRFSFSDHSDNFDEHINKSIISYNNLVDMIITVSGFFIQDNTTVYDLGCSTGKILRKIKKASHANNVSYVGIDNETAFSPYWKEKDIEFKIEDVRKLKFDSDVSLAVSTFTLQFLPTVDRVKLLKNIYDSLIPNGALILCEKTYSNDSMLQEVFTFANYDYKSKFFRYDDIMFKEKELRASMNIRSWDAILQEVEKIGFKKYEVFWKAYNFVGVILVK
jgi:tRNA (cmo5U34)-methyltransferase